jgi:hypothetical protein
VLTQYESDMGLRPSQVGSGVFFAQQNGVWSRFREFALLGSGSGVVANAVDISDHVSAYLPSGMFKMASNDTGNVLFFISGSSGYENRIYVYKFFNRSDGQSAQRVQASWSYWDFAGCDKVLSILCVRESLYCLMQYGTKVYLEVISVMDRLAEETGTPYPMLLDRRVSNTTVTSVAMRMANGVYNAATQTTTWTLPYTANTTTAVVGLQPYPWQEDGRGSAGNHQQRHHLDRPWGLEQRGRICRGAVSVPLSLQSVQDDEGCRDW